MSSLLERLLGDGTPNEQIDLESRQHDVDDALQTAIEQGSYSVAGCGVTGVVVVNEVLAGELVVVPIARFSLGEAVDDPDMGRVWELVGGQSRPAGFF